MPVVALGAPALSTNNAMVNTATSTRLFCPLTWLAIKVNSLFSFFISVLLCLFTPTYLPMPVVALGAPALNTNNAMVNTATSTRLFCPLTWLAIKVNSLFSFFISVLLCLFTPTYLPMPVVALGAPALNTNNAMVRTATSTRPLRPLIWLAINVSSLFSFFISILLFS
jgi:hypothetical protein